MQLITAREPLHALSATATHIYAKHNYAELVMENDYGFSRHCMLAVAGGILCDRVKSPIGDWLIVKSAEHCGGVN